MYKEYLVRQPDCMHDDLYFYMADPSTDADAVAIRYGGTEKVRNRLVVTDGSVLWEMDGHRISFPLYQLSNVRNMLEILTKNNDFILGPADTIYQLDTEGVIDND